MATGVTERMDQYTLTSYDSSTDAGTVSTAFPNVHEKTVAKSADLGSSGVTTFTYGGAGARTYTYIGTTSYVVDGVTYQGFVGEDSSGAYYLFVPYGQTSPNDHENITVTPANASDPGTQWNLDTGAINCFVTGTLIATPDGAVPVESLQPGDLVLTVDGPAMPVRWLGRSVVSRAFADPLRVLPVRIKAGALAENVPSRDLLVSPGHAICIDDLLVHAGALVNGTSIVREQNVLPVFPYYHIELDTHALVIAEGAAAESYLDGAEDIDFQNSDQRVPPAAAEELLLPRIKAQRQLPQAVRAQLAARAAALFGAEVQAA